MVFHGVNVGADLIQLLIMFWICAMLTPLMMQFANPELMRQYGRLLEDFQNNTPFLNDCIFTVIPSSP